MDLLWESASLALCDEVEDVLDCWQSDQENGPYGGGHGNQKMARRQQQLFRYLKKKADCNANAMQTYLMALGY